MAIFQLNGYGMLLTPDIASVKYKNIVLNSDPSSTVTINAISHVSSIYNFNSSINSDVPPKVQIEYQGMPITLEGPTTLYGGYRNYSAQTLQFPRKLCKYIPMQDLKCFPFVITSVEGSCGQEHFNHYVPTFRFIDSNLILVDLGILGPSASCPEDKYGEYWNALKSELDQIPNTNRLMDSIPHYCRWYIVGKGNDAKIMSKTNKMIVHSFLLENTFSTYGDLLFAIDDLVKELDNKIMSQI